MEMRRTISVEDCEDFSNQVAGHTVERLKRLSSKYLLKPMVKPNLFAREVSFYESLYCQPSAPRGKQEAEGSGVEGERREIETVSTSDMKVLPFMAAYFGVANVIEETSIVDTSISKSSITISPSSSSILSNPASQPKQVKGENYHDLDEAVVQNTPNVITNVNKNDSIKPRAQFETVPGVSTSIPSSEETPRQTVVSISERQKTVKRSHPHLVLEDLTKDLVDCSVVDVKMGRQTFEPTASAEKIARELKKYPYQEKIGFRITGLKVYHSDAVTASSVTNATDCCSINSESIRRGPVASVLGDKTVAATDNANKKRKPFIQRGKAFGRSISMTEVEAVLALLFYDGISLRRNVIARVIPQLYVILDWMLKQKKYIFICSSILIIYGKQRLPGGALSKEPAVRVAMVDFAHVLNRDGIARSISQSALSTPQRLPQQSTAAVSSLPGALDAALARDAAMSKEAAGASARNETPGDVAGVPTVVDVHCASVCTAVGEDGEADSELVQVAEEERKDTLIVEMCKSDAESRIVCLQSHTHTVSCSRLSAEHTPTEAKPQIEKTARDDESAIEDKITAPLRDTGKLHQQQQKQQQQQRHKGLVRDGDVLQGSSKEEDSRGCLDEGYIYSLRSLISYLESIHHLCEAQISSTHDISNSTVSISPATAAAAAAATGTGVADTTAAGTDSPDEGTLLDSDASVGLSLDSPLRSPLPRTFSADAAPSSALSEPAVNSFRSAAAATSAAGAAADLADALGRGTGGFAPRDTLQCLDLNSAEGSALPPSFPPPCSHSLKLQTAPAPAAEVEPHSSHLWLGESDGEQTDARRLAANVEYEALLDRVKLLLIREG